MQYKKCPCTRKVPESKTTSTILPTNAFPSFLIHIYFTQKKWSKKSTLQDNGEPNQKRLRRRGNQERRVIQLVYGDFLVYAFLGCGLERERERSRGMN